GLVLKLIVRIPLRQRNIREMKLDKNLYQDPTDGHWHIHFAGEELKIESRGHKGKNVYHIDVTKYAPGFIPPLEEFLKDFRPLLPNADTDPHLLLTKYGTPYDARALYREIADTVALRTKRRFYIHLIRTIWATEYLKEHPGDHVT